MNMGREYRFGFVLEQTLGHVTHSGNLRTAIDADDTVSPHWYPLQFAPAGALEQLPPLRTNWTARASVRTARILSSQVAAQRFDALFFHTQVTTLLSMELMRRVPSVISLDATPKNYDAVGGAYGHRQGSYLAERVKRALNRRPLLAAQALIAWCNWARRSLIDDYGVPADRIAVIAPGVPLDRWPQPAVRPVNGPIRLLFVGADFERKGGEDLLRAFRSLPEGTELHLVTKAPVESAPGIHVHRDLDPNSEALMRLYAEADLFVLPTRADCFPLAIQEAMAAGLPVVATDVGAIGEAVQPGRTGLLVQPGDVGDLSAALTALIADPNRRAAMGRQARLEAERRFDSAANARQILGIMKGLAAQHQAPMIAAQRRGAAIR